MNAWHWVGDPAPPEPQPSIFDTMRQPTTPDALTVHRPPPLTSRCDDCPAYRCSRCVLEPAVIRSATTPEQIEASGYEALEVTQLNDAEPRYIRGRRIAGGPITAPPDPSCNHRR